MRGVKLLLAAACLLVVVTIGLDVPQVSGSALSPSGETTSAIAAEPAGVSVRTECGCRIATHDGASSCAIACPTGQTASCGLQQSPNPGRGGLRRNVARCACRTP